MKKLFSIKKFLNPEESPSTGTICAYYGDSHYRDDEKDVFLSVGDCHVNARLHPTKKESIKDFIEKLKIIRKVVDDFIIFLENLDSK